MVQRYWWSSTTGSNCCKGGAYDYASFDIHPGPMSGRFSLSCVRRFSYAARRCGVQFCRTFVVILLFWLSSDSLKDIACQCVLWLWQTSAVLCPLVHVIPRHHHGRTSIAMWDIWRSGRWLSPYQLKPVLAYTLPRWNFFRRRFHTHFRDKGSFLR